MDMIAPLPESLQDKIAGNTHPGLALDKYVASFGVTDLDDGKFSEKVQLQTIKKIVNLSQKDPDGIVLKDLLNRRRKMLNHLNAEEFSGITASYLTLHLARASALENAGICLHPIYGFAYLPGSGLKGMARAYAETIWKPSQPKNEQEAASNIIEAIFGGAANPKHKKSDTMNGCAGKVIFHDAWPTKWPRLITDILNNHHSGYYGGKNPLGDWENPIPVYFLSVSKGTEFSFAVSMRKPGKSSELLGLSKKWVVAALYNLGAGAKTNSGYGCFRCGTEAPFLLDSPAVSEFKTEVELVTPAFLAGASQNQDDCELRPATLRGLLRWWWRTLHTEFVEHEVLREMESIVWGDTKAAGAVRVTITKSDEAKAILYDFKQKFMPKPDFKAKNELISPAVKKMTQGLFYISYGMADGGRKRWFMPPGVKWTVILSAKDRKFNGQIIKAENFLSEAKSALWLLCKIGGVGSKSRKGFGSLKMSFNNCDLDTCKCRAENFRKDLNIPIKKQIEPKSPSINKMIGGGACKVITPWSNHWFALDQLGFAVQEFMQKFKHQAIKKALGLPRKIKPPVHGSFKNPKTNRHSSPVFYHFSNSNDGFFIISFYGFPSCVLPDYNTSHDFIQKYLREIESNLKERCRLYKDKGIKAEPNLHKRPKSEKKQDATESIGRGHTKIDCPKIRDISSIEYKKEIWENVDLNWKPNTDEITISCKEKKCVTKERKLFPEKIAKNLFNRRKKKAKASKVEVKIEGNKVSVVQIFD